MMNFEFIQKKVFQVICIYAVMILTVTVLFVIPEDVLSENEKPVAVIDGTLNVVQGKTVYLDGSLSSDPNGAPLDYQWTLLSIPEDSLAEIEDSSDSEASFKADVVGLYKVKLVVTNGVTDSDPAYAEITATEGE